MTNEEEITEEISRLYYKLCKQERILFKGKREIIEIYYEFEKKFEKRLNILLEEYHKEKMAISKIIKEIMKGEINDNKRNIRRRLEKARKIYRIISVDGGKEKIKTKSSKFGRIYKVQFQRNQRMGKKLLGKWNKNCQEREFKEYL